MPIAEAEEAPDVLAVGGVEAEVADRLGDARLRSSLVAQLRAGQAWASSAHSRWVKLTM